MADSAAIAGATAVDIRYLNETGEIVLDEQPRPSCRASISADPGRLVGRDRPRCRFVSADRSQRSR